MFMRHFANRQTRPLIVTCSPDEFPSMLLISSFFLLPVKLLLWGRKQRFQRGNKYFMSCMNLQNATCSCSVLHRVAQCSSVLVSIA